MSADLAPDPFLIFGPRPQTGADKKKGGKPKPAARKGENMLNLLTRTVEESKATEVVAPFAGAYPQEVRRIKALLSDRIRRSSKLPDGEMISETVTLTPAMAEHILVEHNRGNRSLRRGRVKQFAEIIRSGRFKTTSQGISFARDGSLNNGQHRLFGIIAAAVPVDVYVTFGEGRDAFDVLDTGGTRGGADTLHSLGYQNVALLAGAARVLRDIILGAPGANTSIANDEIGDVVASLPGVEDVLALGGSLGKRFKATGSGCVAAMYLIRRDSAHSPRLEEFVQRLSDGANQMPRSPILTLRDLLQTRQVDVHVRSHSARQACTAAAIILAWNAWLARKRPGAGALKWSPSEPFPIAE
jgi:hypothetical protein